VLIGGACGSVSVINYVSDKSIYTNAVFGFSISNQGFARVPS
jgi:hypothetical protein